MTHQHLDSCGCCHKAAASSTVQTLQELDFERGICSAALNGEICRIEKYLNANGDPKVLDSSGYSALHYAARSGHLAVCQLLIQHGACVNAVTRSGNVTPLHRAVYCGNTDVVRLLVEHGASICHQDTDGKTALHKAAEKGHLEIAKFLIKADTKVVQIADLKGNTPDAYAPPHDRSLWQSLSMNV